jgi:4'-phosphopantetheinyl transferase
VWRVTLNDETLAERYWPLLSAEEQGRAQRFYREILTTRYVVAHGALRTILAGYVGDRPEALEFVTGAHGKPALVPRSPDAPSIEFNLSHSDDLALIAVARSRPVGVDVERWSDSVEHLELAERFFSPVEHSNLLTLASEPELVAPGFFSAWTRKEAYMKATGYGISRGLHHFDVTLAPDEPAKLLQDRLDATASDRWMMVALSPAAGYSGALVVAAPLDDVLLFETDGPP